MLLWTHTPQHKQNSASKSIIIQQRVGVFSSSAGDRIGTWTCKFMDKTPQIAEEQLVMTMDKAQETKLQRYKSNVSVFSADISKSE